MAMRVKGKVIITPAIFKHYNATAGPAGAGCGSVDERPPERKNAL